MGGKRDLRRERRGREGYSDITAYGQLEGQPWMWDMEDDVRLKLDVIGVCKIPFAEKR